MLLQLFVDNTRLAMPKTSLDFVFFYDVNQNLKKRPFVLFIHLGEPLRKQKVVVRDLWISIRFVCFCVSRLDALFLKSTVSFTLAVRFFLSSLHWNMASLDSKGEIVPIELPLKSRGNTTTEGWKRTATFPLTFTFADKHSGCYGNGLIDVTEKFEFGACSIWIVEDAGRGSFLFLTYLGRSKETRFAG